MLIRVPKMGTGRSSVEICLQVSQTAKRWGAGSVCAFTDGKKMGIHLGRLTLEESQRLQECLLPLIAG